MKGVKRRNKKDCKYWELRVDKTHHCKINSIELKGCHGVCKDFITVARTNENDQSAADDYLDYLHSRY